MLFLNSQISLLVGTQAWNTPSQKNQLSNCENRILGNFGAFGNYSHYENSWHFGLGQWNSMTVAGFLPKIGEGKYSQKYSVAHSETAITDFCVGWYPGSESLLSPLLQVGSGIGYNLLAGFCFWFLMGLITPWFREFSTFVLTFLNLTILKLE